MGPIYNENVCLQCRWVRIYAKMKFPYYSVFTMILAVLFYHCQISCMVNVNVRIKTPVNHSSYMSEGVFKMHVAS